MSFLMSIELSLLDIIGQVIDICVSTKLIGDLTNKVRESRMIKLLISLNMSFS